jgi:hypothetical protein
VRHMTNVDRGDTRWERHLLAVRKLDRPAFQNVERFLSMVDVK